MKRYLIGIPAVLVGLYISSMVILYCYQERLIFQATELNKDHAYSLKQPFEELWLTTSDQARLNALLIKANQPKGVILYFHGNKGDLERWRKIVAPLTRYNYDVFIMDYRGYGKSEGERTEALLYQDATLAYDYLRQYYDPKDIVIYGRSLGSTFAAHVAAHRPAQQLILETPFYSMQSVVEGHYALFPTQRLLNFPFLTHQFMAKVEEPVTMMHGNADLVIPYHNAERLFKATQNAVWVHFEGGGHNDLSSYELYWETLEELL